jgi:hypothetical protein
MLHYTDPISRKYINISFALAFLAIKASVEQRNDDALTHFYGVPL